MYTYLLEVNILFLVFTLAYWLLIRKGKLLKLNRALLLTTIVFSLFLPLLPSWFSTPTFIAEPIIEAQEGIQSFFEQAQEIEDNALVVGTPIGEVSDGSQFSLSTILLAVFLIVFLFFLIRIIQQCLIILKIIIYSNNQKLHGLTLVHSQLDLAPFSFFRYLILNPDKHQDEDLEQILAHESAHISQKHYLDILFAELIKILFWYNPAAWVLNKLIKMNLEYLADEEVLDKGADRKNYQYHLLRMSLLGRSTGLMLAMNYSPIKMRIAMMNSSKPNLVVKLRYFLLLTIFMGAYFAINPSYAQTTTVEGKTTAVSEKTTVVTGYPIAITESASTVNGNLPVVTGYPIATTESASTVNGNLPVVTGYPIATTESASTVNGNSPVVTGSTATVESVNTVGSTASVVPRKAYTTSLANGKEDIFLVIRKDTKRETLDKAKKLLAERNIKVQYHNLNFNDGEITAISMSIHAPNYNGNLSYEPLEEPLVFYYLPSDKRVGFVYGVPKDLDAEHQNIINRVSGILIKGTDGMHMSGAVDIDEAW